MFGTAMSARPVATETRLSMTLDAPDPAASAALLLAIIEGAVFLGAVGSRDLADAAAAAAR